MARKCKAPAGTGASRDSFAGLSPSLATALAMQPQFLAVAHHVRPEMAAMLAAFAFGGGAHG